MPDANKYHERYQFRVGSLRSQQSVVFHTISHEKNNIKALVPSICKYVQVFNVFSMCDTEQEIWNVIFMFQIQLLIFQCPHKVASTEIWCIQNS